MSEDCQFLRDFLAGNLEFEYFSDIGIESLREHWHECEECQAHLPDAISLIDSRAKAYLSRIGDNLRLLHRQYEYAESRVLHPPVTDSLGPLNFRPEDLQPKVVKFDWEDLQTLSHSPARQPLTELLKLLAQEGGIIREQLQFLNERWGLCYFCVARGDSCEYYSEVCGPLISSLPQDVRLFVFRAILASEILGFFPEEFPAEFGPIIYRTIENAAPAFLREYLKEQESLTHNASSPSPLHEVLNGPLKMLSEKIEWIEDGVERLTNVGLEQVDLLKSGKQGISVDDDELCELFGGGNLYRKLSPETQHLLRKAELHFRNPQEDDFYPAIKYFHRAYECEFRGRITRELIDRLVNQGHKDKDYGSAGHELLKHGRFNGKLSLGEQLWYLGRDKKGLPNDTRVREILLALGLNVDEIHRTATDLNNERNRAEHPPEGSQGSPRRDAERVRDMIRGSRSILMLLFPTAKAGKDVRSAG